MKWTPPVKMRTGFNMVQEHVSPDVDFVRMVVSMLSILNEEAIKSGLKFAKCCGRHYVTPQDIILALKYETHAFWDKDIDERFVERLREERTHTYETDEEDTGEEDTGEEDTGEDADDEMTEVSCDFVSGDKSFYDKVMSINNGWSSWCPDDGVKQLLKQAIENTEKKML